MSHILISGTPGVGKTTLCKKLSSELNLKHIDISNFIKEEKIYEEYDDELDTYVFDENKVKKILDEKYKNTNIFCIFDTHTPELCSNIKNICVFVIKEDTKILRERYEDRKYSEKKIMENITCEIMDVVEDEAREYFDNVIIIEDGDMEKRIEIIKDFYKK
ncbi:putative nucleotide kinase [Spraguea lophii 42_110]|uniref:Adenylate kinase isoenzyme 6 homolog n=1 Tax=Spraguea lophii (strain 42_110) TaxID=1358809 RepID=S7XUK4_SPRLO|nr:putative nucleotide kinase [Spraguea lophii 42_110]